VNKDPGATENKLRALGEIKRKDRKGGLVGKVSDKKEGLRDSKRIRPTEPNLTSPIKLERK